MRSRYRLWTKRGTRARPMVEQSVGRPEQRFLALRVAFVCGVLTGAVLTTVSTTRAIRFFTHDAPRFPFGIAYDAHTGTLFVHDFATTLAFTRFVWRERPARPYGVEAHRAMMRAWTGAPISVAMPFG